MRRDISKASYIRLGVQAGREVLFKIKNAYFQEALQSQPEQTVRGMVFVFHAVAYHPMPHG